MKGNNDKSGKGKRDIPDIPQIREVIEIGDEDDEIEMYRNGKYLIIQTVKDKLLN